MRFILTLILGLLSVAGLYAQTSIQKDSLKRYYLIKSDHQRTAGWVLLGGGTALAITGIIIFSQSDIFSSNSQSDLGGALFTIGILADLGSIPLFIGASKNARKAAVITINDQKILLPRANVLTLQRLPSLTLKIGLGH